MRRRTLLQGAVPLCAGLAGCSGLASESPMLSLTVFSSLYRSTETPPQFDRATDPHVSRLSRNA